jgi:predicted nucleic acid-binding protein
MRSSKGIAILDTNVASFVLKGLPLAAEYRTLVRGFDLHLSFVTAAELRVWANRNRLGARRQLYLDVFLAELTIMPYCAGMDRTFAELVRKRESIGKPIAFPDAWIAATALFHGVPLVTHDANFAHTQGLRIITASDEVRANQRLLDTARVQLPMLPGMHCHCSV